MDKTLELKIAVLTKAINRLNEAVVKYQETNDPFLRDSVIKRFEFCFDLFWKTFKQLLRSKYGDETTSPKETFRALLKNSLAIETETETMLKMTDDRNMIVHEYSEYFSIELVQKICTIYLKIMKNKALLIINS
ncbi:MAG: HI0074 family nucleotidyltransferase substrate-binding subunit [Candidatus Falkowbacteria bacterium]|nr:HI0074 family nucleotidyltransferase substrate-binding subunit [Candidatus Falkowbacteria bacterium]